MLPEYDYWQFWRNTADTDVIRFLKLFTDLPLDRIRQYELLEGSALNEAKRILADECTRLLHGDACLLQIHTTVDSLFAGAGGDLDSLPKVQLLAADVGADKTWSVVDMLVKAGMVASKGEARRLIKAGGVKASDQKVSDEYAIVSRADFDDQGRLKLSAGKKKHVLMLWPQSG
jgi:tyrosyl-tRNA synthetase